MSTALDLPTLVVEEGGVSAERLDDALQRQVLSGGGLDTVLLEMGLVDEPTLLTLLEQSERLPAVGKDVLDAADRAAVAMFPRRLAEKHGIVPFSLEGRVMSVAVARAPDMNLLDEIGFMLSVYVRPHVTTEVRIAYALHRLYGAALSPRHESVLALLGEDTSELVTEPAEEGQEATSEPTAQEATSAQWEVVSAGHAVSGADDPPRSPPFGAERTDEGPPADIPSAEEARQRLEARMEAEEAAERAHEEQRRRERVSWTVDDAIAELALSDERDAMLDVTLRFAYRRLSTAAIFVVQRTGQERQPGFVLWDLIHPTLGRRDLPHLTIPTSGDNALARLHEIRSPFLGPVAEDDPLVSAFGARPRAALLLPIIVGDVLAGVLYGDNGEKVIPPSSLAELHMVVPRLEMALRNLIVRRKRAAADGGAEAPRPVAVEPRALEASVPVIEVDLDGLDEPFEEPAADEEALDAALEGMSAASPGTFAEARAPDGEAPHEPPAPPGEAPSAVVSAAASSAVVSPSTDASPAASVSDAAMAPSASSADAPRAASDTETLEKKPRPRQTPPPLPKKRRPAATATPAPVAPSAPMAAEGLIVAVAEAPALSTSSYGSAPVTSPGANARESLLLATWKDWLRYEDNDTDELIGGLRQPGEAGRMAASAVVAKGDDAMPSLARYFPGVLVVHPFGAMELRPDVAELSDATACLVRLGADRAAPILVGELGHEDRLHRYTAVWCLSELRVPAALPRLAQRAFDPELRIALLALEVLDGYRDVAGHSRVLSWLRDFLRRGDAFQRKRAILAAAELSDREALEPLVNLLGTRPKEIAEEARRALVEITMQDFGFSERRWRAWIADNLRHPRTWWLLEGLAHKDLEIRERAQQELNRLTGENFGYRADAPRKDREASLKIWSAWWAEQPEGRWP